MERTVLWDLSEMLGEIDYMLREHRMSHRPALKELIADMASLALRDLSAGTNNFLDEFIENNVGSEFHGLALFFRSRAVGWYKEITAFTDHAIAEFDWFEVDDIVQLTPTFLNIKLNVGYYHENPDACMDITEFPLTSMSQ